ncbi:cyclic pyranopterin monophosphate synthase MoaC [Pseudothermotoga elfii]
MTGDFSHIDKKGNIRMVDITSKENTERIAKALAIVQMNQETLFKIKENEIKKGDVITTAKIAGIIAAKRTSELIPLCHNINLTHAEIEFILREEQNSIEIISTVKCREKTGAEMEALTAASVAALTIYDMCKSIDKSMVIEKICLLEKSGGKSGHWKRNELSSDNT